VSTTPDYRIVVDGQAITPKVQRRLIGLTLRDRRGLEADQLDLTLSDADGRLAIPPTGAEIAVHLGWRSEELTHCGTYLVDSLEHSSAPDQLTIHASSANFSETAPLKIQRTRSWHGETIGSLVDWIAGELNLAPAVADALANREIAHLDQTNESNANLLTRLGKQHGAIAAIKHGRLLFIERGRGITATGRPLPPLTIMRSAGDRHTWRGADREGRYTGVRAAYWDREQAKRVEVMAGQEGYTKTLRESYAVAHLAAAAAEAEWSRIQRAGAGMEITLARGAPGIPPETPVILTGWGKPQIDRRWILDSAEHALTEGGLVSRLTLEPAIDA
jgi:phage protein D